MQIQKLEDELGLIIFDRIGLVSIKNV